MFGSSDADTDVLADYVIALVKSEDPDEQIRINCEEQLKDFLAEHTKGFVNDVFSSLRLKSYKPGYKPPSKSQVPPSFNAGAASFTPQASNKSPSVPHNAPAAQVQAPSGPASQMNGQGLQSKKRSFNNMESDQKGPQVQANERPQKQMRRGGGERGRGGRGGRGGVFPNQQQPMPQMPQGFPQFDPNNPMASMMAMQAMGFPVPGLEQMQAMEQQRKPRSRGRCRDYDNKGFCARGVACPYDHGSDHIVAPSVPEGEFSRLIHSLSRLTEYLAYDPANPSPPFMPSQGSPPPFSSGPSQRGQHTRGRGRGDRGGRGRGGHQRASFSKAGPNNDTRITSIVVEQIPEDKFSDEAVRAFFSEFGTIEDVNLQPYKRLAVIKFGDYDSARSAYESPKVIFDNRFVKVYWYKPDSDQVQQSTQNAINGIKTEDGDAGVNNGVGATKQEDEMMIDPEEFARKQAEAQKIHDEKQRRQKEAEDAKTDLDRKIKAQAEERRKMMEKMEALAAKSGRKVSQSPAPKAGGVVNGAAGEGGESEEATSAEERKARNNEQLRAQLAALKAEAEAIGLPAEETEEDTSGFGYAAYNPRGRGGFSQGGRGRGRGRGRGGYDPSRGGYGAPRGGGGYWQGGGVARLDNRPKTVQVRALDEGVDFGDEKMAEGLRAFLYVSTPFSPPLIRLSFVPRASTDRNREPAPSPPSRPPLPQTPPQSRKTPQPQIPQQAHKKQPS